MNSIVENLVNCLGVFVIPLFILGALYFFFPLIVLVHLAGIKSRIDLLRNEADTKDAAILSSQTEHLKELKVQNNLTRQLLKAYGHEPEA